MDAGFAKEIHRTLKEKWEGFLSPQDKGFRAHYTLQNFVEEEEEREKSFEEVKSGWREDRGWVDGVVLWRYRKGYWDKIRKFDFEGTKRGG